MPGDNPTPELQHEPKATDTVNPTSTPPYTALAAGYDLVMRHVEYELWAEYAHRLLRKHHQEVQSILELGCGTGSLALALQPLGDYDYIATDGSEEMIRVARRKAETEEVPIRFGVADFSAFEVDEPVDAVILLYDGMNYLLKAEQVASLLQHAYAALRSGGLFLFDQSTPANSLNNQNDFEDKGRAPNFSYVRHSRYDPDAHLHTTTFELTVRDATFREMHVQRAYTLSEVQAFVTASPFDKLAAYDGFSTAPATATSERIHWVLRRLG